MARLISSPLAVSLAAIVLFVCTIGFTISAGWYDVRSTCPTSPDPIPAGPSSAGSVLNYYPKTIGLGGRLCVVVAQASSVISAKSPLHLYVDGLPLKKSIGSLVDQQNNYVLFDFARSAEDVDVWTKIIGNPGLGTVSASIGVGNGTDAEFLRGQAPPITIRIFDMTALILGIATFLCAAYALVLYARGSGILRDGDPTSPYSLGRCQMAIWLYLVTGAFLYIWMVTGEYNGIITTASLALLGISGTTGLMAIAVPGANAGAKSEGFLNDILNDSSGVALHRLQMVVWTVILAVIFLAEVSQTFKLPTFDTNLLMLMGLSGLTYVGFKIQEK